MTSKRVFWVLLIGAVAVFLADAVVQAVTQVIWPAHTPAWTTRAFSVSWLAAVLLAVAAGLTYAWNRRRHGKEADAS